VAVQKEMNDVLFYNWVPRINAENFYLGTSFFVTTYLCVMLYQGGDETVTLSRYV
jgi:hypothetical protein